MGIFSGLFRSRDKPQNRTTGSAYSFFFGSSSAGKRVNERSAMQMTAVYSCVRILAEAVAGLPLHLYRYKEDGGKEKAIDHPLYLLLHDEPNPEMSSFVFRETLMTHLLLWGNAYAQIIRNGKGEVIALYPLMPDRMTVDRDRDGKLYYEYTVSMDDAPTVKGSLVRLHPSDVLHIPGLGFDGLVGYSPIAMAKNAIGMAIACEEYGAKFFANGAAPGGVLEHPGTIKDPQRVRESWQSTFGGSGNSNKIAVLEEGMKYTPIGISPEQAQFLETRKFQINEIARIFRVPPHMVGDLEKSSFSNIEQQSLEFVKYTLEPWLVRWEQSIQRTLFSPEEKKRYFAKFNVEGLLRGDYASRMSGYATARRRISIMTILELREKRAKAWEAAKAFLDSHRNDKGILSAEDDAAYTRMEQEITDLGKEIARLERQEALDAELNRPVNKPLTGRPMSGKEDAKTGRATDEYRQNFWNMMRSKTPMPTVLNALQIGTDSEGGYLVPDEYERTLVEALEEENIFRQIAKVIQTSSGDRKIPVVATKGTASWIDEEGAYTESDDSFGQVSIGAYKLGTMIKVSEELLNDSVFDLESYISREFARRIGAKEEEAFFTGDGSGKPLGILAASGGAETGITAASATAITADELIDLFYSLKAPYRRNAVWVLNDSTIKAIRKLKDSQGQYLWQPSLTAGAPDLLLGKPVRTSAYMPTIAADAKTIAFGDFSYYWIADRQGRSFKRLNELYAANGQVGFLASQRVDGKLILSEAIKVLAQKAAG